MVFREKKIILAVTGSIAAYKAAQLVRLLVREGAEVRVLMTGAAKDFITPLTLSTLSRNPVLSDLFSGDTWSNHVALGRWADLMLIAPLSCNTLAKMAGGHCDNMVLATWLSATCPVAVAPAMDEDMWRHPATRRNLDALRFQGVHILPVGTGELASGLYGEGRMAEPEEIVHALKGLLGDSAPLKGKKALVTAGPTFEPLDPVRFIGNHSSGKMGLAITAELARRGAEVDLVMGPTATSGVSLSNVNLIRVQTAAEMHAACVKSFERADIAVMAAAVADYTPVQVAQEKIKKKSGSLTIELQPTVDILKELGSRKRENQLLVGFALETENEREHAIRKLQSKKADLIVLNSLRDEGAGFGHDTNKITLFSRDGREQAFPRKSKREVAEDIVNRIIEMYAS